MYVKKATDGKFYFLDNYMAVYYKLLNERGGVHAVNNPIEKGDFHSFPPGFRSVSGKGSLKKTSDILKDKSRFGFLLRVHLTQKEEVKTALMG